VLRSLVLIFCCFCTAVVLSEAAALILLWQQGLLSAHHLKEIRLVLSNNPQDQDLEVEDQPVVTSPSLEEITNARMLKILDLDKREGELAMLKKMATDRAVALDEQQAAFRAQRKAFEEELARLNEQVTTAANEQARGVLLAMASRDAMEQLMQLPLPQCVVLLKGMPEKTIAKILREFKNTPEQLKRSQEIFEAISRNPEAAELIQNAAEQLQPTPGDS